MIEKLESVAKAVLKLDPFNRSFGVSEELYCDYCNMAIGFYKSRHEDDCPVPALRISLREAGYEPEEEKDV